VLSFEDRNRFVNSSSIALTSSNLAGNVRAMRLHVVAKGTGPAVVFLHGMGSTSATWTACMNLLAPTHHVVALDLLGHGASPVPEDPAEYSRDAALVDIDELLATLPPVVLVGHSLGGYLTMAHAVTRPNVTRGIVVLNTGPGFRDPEKREQWNERSRRNAHRFDVPVQAAELNLQHDSVVMDHLAEITVPTLVLAGDADRPEYTASGQYIERKMRHARLVVVEGGGHAMHEESHAADVSAIIAEFVASLSPVA
jgi:pimeloyl-ACP methyl ester carboxylesterase